MAFVHRQSCEDVKSELDLFTLPTTQTSIEQAQWIEHRPVASIGTGGPIEFLLRGSGDDYLDVASDEGEWDRYRCCYGSGPGEQLDAFVVQSSRRVIERHFSDTFHQHVFLPCLHRNVVGSRKRSEGHATDQRPVAQRHGWTHGRDRRHKRRFEAKTNTHERKSYSRLHVDLFFQDRYLLNGVDMKIRLVQSKDAFGLMAAGADVDFKVCIVEAALFARKAKLNPAVQMAHIKALEKATAKYPLRRVDCKVFSIPRGSMSHTQKTYI